MVQVLKLLFTYNLTSILALSSISTLFTHAKFRPGASNSKDNYKSSSSGSANPLVPTSLSTTSTSTGTSNTNNDYSRIGTHFNRINPHLVANGVGDHSDDVLSDPDNDDEDAMLGNPSGQRNNIGGAGGVGKAVSNLLCGTRKRGIITALVCTAGGLWFAKWVSGADSASPATTIAPESAPIGFLSSPPPPVLPLQPTTSVWTNAANRIFSQGGTGSGNPHPNGPPYMVNAAAFATTTPFTIPQNMPLDNMMKSNTYMGNGVDLSSGILPLSRNALPYSNYVEYVSLDSVESEFDKTSSQSVSDPRHSYPLNGLHIKENSQISHDNYRTIPHFIEYLPKLSDSPQLPEAPWTDEEEILIRDLLIGKYKKYVDLMVNGESAQSLTIDNSVLSNPKGYTTLSGIPCKVQSRLCANKKQLILDHQAFEQQSVPNPSLSLNQKATIDSKVPILGDNVLQHWLDMENDEEVGDKNSQTEVLKGSEIMGEAYLVRTYHGEWLQSLSSEKKLAEENGVSMVKRVKCCGKSRSEESSGSSSEAESFYHDGIFYGPSEKDENLQLQLETLLSTGHLYKSKEDLESGRQLISEGSSSSSSASNNVLTESNVQSKINSSPSTLVHEAPGAPQIRSFLVLGYGTDPITREDFWLIRGTSKEFGVNGYLKLKKGNGNSGNSLGELLGFDEIWTVGIEPREKNGQQQHPVTAAGPGSGSVPPSPVLSDNQYIDGISDLPELLKNPEKFKNRLHLRMLSGESWEMQEAMKEKLARGGVPPA